MYCLCLDCGATNVRAMLVDENGTIVSQSSQPNTTVPGKENPDYHLWDVDRIFRQLAECARKASCGIDTALIRAITITTFGVDGALVDREGRLLYPVISWKCPRGGQVMSRIGEYIPQEELNRISGVGEFAFNTINKLVWLKENTPELFGKACAWLFISNILAYRLTNVMATDRTMAGTSQMTDLVTGEFSPAILAAIGVSPSLFPPIVDAGHPIGMVTKEAAELLELPLAGIPVISAGHDTQFAIFGSGAGSNQPVLSSGTWEILMARSSHASLSAEDYAQGATVEIDSDPVLRNPGLQWIGSGIIEWVRDCCYRNEHYDIMDAEAATVPPGCDGVKLYPDFLPSDVEKGSITGLILGRSRSHIYRAAMEALSFRLKSRLKRLETVGGFQSDSLILVGGAAKNKIWTQMRADILGIPVKVSTVSESTVLGSAMFGLAGAGIYTSPRQAREHFNISYETWLPGKQSGDYAGLPPHAF